MPLCGGFIRGTSRPCSRDVRGYELMKRRQQGAAGTARRQKRVVGNPRLFSAGEESGGSNLWPTDSCGSGGSKGLSALPTADHQSAENPADSQTSAALIYGRQIRAASAAASGSRQRRLPIRREFCGFAEFGNFNLWFPNSSTEPAAASGCRHCRPAASACRLSLLSTPRGWRCPCSASCRCRQG